ncbi:MAG TPA: trehalose-6-phosphate synthase [Gemmatimonadales bacterium]
MGTRTPKRPSRRRSREPLVIAANTLPIRRKRELGRARWVAAPGGLASALTPIVREAGGAWIGWTGSAGQTLAPFRHGGISMVPVSLSRQDIVEYYEGFCNGTLWPLFHGAIREPEYHRPWWRAYATVNERFADAVARSASPGGTVWVQDYHLLLLPALLRRRRPDLRVGFFLHVPFPTEDLFVRLPWRQQVLEGMLGADVVGVQTPGAARNLLRLARRFAGADVRGNVVSLAGHQVVVGAFPISVDVARIEAVAALPRVRRRVDELRRTLGRGRKVLLGVDRLDYTKGIDLRLKAYAEVLTRRPELATRTVLVQVAVPSRGRVAEYQRLQERVDAMVGRLNGEHGDVGVEPVSYVRRNLDLEDLVAMYALADVMVVTPLADGMNLVAKEYVASRTDGRGTLILSEFAGAAAELRGALLVNPHDVNGMADAVERALAMSPAEQRRRMRQLRGAVQANTVQDWAAGFLGALKAERR